MTSWGTSAPSCNLILRSPPTASISRRILFRRPDTASGAVLNLRVPLPLLFSSRFRRNGDAPIGRLLHGICRFKRVDAIPFRFLVGFLTKFIQFAPKADANSNSAKRKLEQKRIFSLQNLVETKTCCTFAIANGKQARCHNERPQRNTPSLMIKQVDRMCNGEVAELVDALL